MISSRDANTSGGNYAENIGGNYIQAQQVVIHPPTAPPCNNVSAPGHENNGSTKRLAFAIAGTIDQADEVKLQAILRLLRKLAGDDSIEIVDIQSGSIKLILSGSPEGLEKLKALFETRELTEVLETPVEAVQFIEPETGEETKTINTSQAIREWRNRLDLKRQNLTTAKGTDEGENIETIRAWGKQQDLSGRNLNNTDLSHTNLSRVNLSRANLKGTNLSFADLSRADLSDANLRHANLSHTELTHANLSHADLSYANLSHANLINVDFAGADLSGADLSNVNFFFAAHNLTSLSTRTFNESSNINLLGAVLQTANLSGAILRGANFCKADLSLADLSRADLYGADLHFANLREANVTNTNFTACRGISKVEKKDLIRRGAIFDDAPGDRSATYALTPR